MTKSSINRREIAKLMQEMQEEFDKHPMRVPLAHDNAPPALRDNTALQAPTQGTTINYNGPVIYGHANAAQLAWNNQTVNQSQGPRTQITPGFELIAQAVTNTLAGLNELPLSEEERTDGRLAGEQVLNEVTKPEPDRSVIRRAISVLKGILAPIAVGITQGAGTVSQEWTRTALEKLGSHF